MKFRSEIYLIVLFIVSEAMYSSQPLDNHDATRLTVADILSTMASTVDAMTPTTVWKERIVVCLYFLLTFFSV